MQNSKLQAVQQFYPDNWDRNEDYNKRRYKLIKLYKRSPEYQQVERKFSYCRVEYIQRIQNPYIFGPYLLRKEQLKHQSENFEERTMYHAVKGNDLFTALEYNLDVRRYYGSCEKNPKLFVNIEQAVETLSESGLIIFVIVCSVIVRSFDINSVIIESDRDAERLPQFVVKLT